MHEIVASCGMEMNQDQCRAARALLKMTQARLAKAAGVGVSTVTDFELGSRKVSPEMVQAIRIALEIAGVMFDGGNGGVKLRKGTRK
jgi:transcriptional regulator with XRE-family HTH domain